MGENFWELLKDPVAWEGIQRILIELGAIFCIWAGYRFYMLGRDSKSGLSSYKANFLTSGTGSGLCCIGFGTIILLTGLVTGEKTGSIINNAEELKTPGVISEHIDAIERSIAKMDYRIEELLKTMEKHTPDNSTQSLLELSQLKNQLEKLAASVAIDTAERESKKAESRHLRRKRSDYREDNSSSR